VEVSRESYEAGAQLQRAAYPPPPRVSIAEAMDQAAAMADRFHRMFLRSLRALRDLRRYTPTVVVANAGQVNVSAGPQINLAGRDSAERTLAGERDVDTSD